MSLCCMRMIIFHALEEWEKGPCEHYKETEVGCRLLQEMQITLKKYNRGASFNLAVGTAEHRYLVPQLQVLQSPLQLSPSPAQSALLSTAVQCYCRVLATSVSWQWRRWRTCVTILSICVTLPGYHERVIQSWVMVIQRVIMTLSQTIEGSPMSHCACHRWWIRFGTMCGRWLHTCAALHVQPAAHHGVLYNPSYFIHSCHSSMPSPCMVWYIYARPGVSCDIRADPSSLGHVTPRWCVARQPSCVVLPRLHVIPCHPMLLCTSLK